MSSRLGRKLGHRGLAIVLTGVSAGVVGMGCTILIPFDEVTLPSDATAEGASTSDVPDVAVTGADGLAPLADSGVSDAADANADACAKHTNGYYCAGDQITWPVKDDLITCTADQVSSVRECTTGQGCIGMLNGYPDECDECATKADGEYCGRDFTTWQPENANQRVRCQTGREVGLLLCTTCKSDGADSVCE